MDSEQQAWEALRVVRHAETLAARNSKNNGIIPLVWGMSVFFVLAGFDFLPRLFSDPDLGLLVSGGLPSIVPLGTALWTTRYQRRLPVQPLKVDYPRLFTYWGFYHAAVLMGGLTLGTHFWRLHCMRLGTWTLIGLVDAAPLLWVGWNQRRRTQEGRL